jgi:hypothetical protein
MGGGVLNVCVKGGGAKEGQGLRQRRVRGWHH